MHPILFETKFFVLHILWVFFAIAIIISTYSIIKLATKNSLKIQFLSGNAWKLILWGLIGARIIFVIMNYSGYFYNFNIDSILRLFYFWDKGLDGWGAILAMVIKFYFLCKKTDTAPVEDPTKRWLSGGQNFWRWMDVFTISTIIGIAIISIGTFFDGINYGNETSLPWGVNFESPSIRYAVPIHPTQIYAFLYSALIAWTLIWLNNLEKVRNYEPKGLLAMIGVTAFSFFHFLEEFVRGDDSIKIFNIRFGQIISFIIFITALSFLHKYHYKTKSFAFKLK